MYSNYTRTTISDAHLFLVLAQLDRREHEGLVLAVLVDGALAVAVAAGRHEAVREAELGGVRGEVSGGWMVGWVLSVWGVCEMRGFG